MIVKAHPVTDSLIGFPPAREGMRINALEFHRAPQPCDDDVATKSAAPVHRDAHPGLFQSLRPYLRRELAALIGIEDLRQTIVA